MASCVQLVISKCSPNDSKLNLKTLKQSIDQLFLDDIEAQIQEQFPSSLSKGRSDEDKDDEEKQINSIYAFYNTISENACIHDPLDRPLPSDENKQSISTQLLLGKIETMQFIDSK